MDIVLYSEEVFSFLPCQNGRHFAIVYRIENCVQILRLFAFRVMRCGYCIIWRGDMLDNEDTTHYLRELSERLQANIYPCRTDEEVRNIVSQKKS